jgi:hypothetical protein
MRRDSALMGAADNRTMNDVVASTRIKGAMNAEGQWLVVPEGFASLPVSSDIEMP